MVLLPDTARREMGATGHLAEVTAGDGQSRTTPLRSYKCGSWEVHRRRLPPPSLSQQRGWNVSVAQIDNLVPKPEVECTMAEESCS
jgi:hypothetical protein